MQQATNLQAEWQNFSLSSAAQGLTNAQHPSSECLCWAKFGIQSKWQTFYEAVLEQQNCGLRDRGGF